MTSASSALGTYALRYRLAFSCLLIPNAKVRTMMIILHVTCLLKEQVVKESSIF
jgi:hypothetical protein